MRARRLTEEQKLVRFFRTLEGDGLGRRGDYDNLSPAETAIRAMAVLVDLAQRSRMPRRAELADICSRIGIRP